MDTGESSLTYSWTATAVPSGATRPAFSANGTNAAQNSTATFSKAGNYTFQVTITYPGDVTITSSVNVTVNQTLSAITLSPSFANLNAGATQQFAATGYDQFGNALTSQPTFTWTTSVAGGAINSSGLFTSPNTTALGTVTAAYPLPGGGSLSGNSVVIVTEHAPTVATPASAVLGGSPVTTAALSVLGADVDGASRLTYTWTATAVPSGARSPRSAPTAPTPRRTAPPPSARRATTRSRSRSPTRAA